MTTPHINQLREHLMETLAALRDREHPMEPDRAGFLEEPAQITSDSSTAGLPNGIKSITRHRLVG